MNIEVQVLQQSYIQARNWHEISQIACVTFSSYTHVHVLYLESSTSNGEQSTHHTQANAVDLFGLVAGQYKLCYVRIYIVVLSS